MVNNQTVNTSLLQFIYAWPLGRKNRIPDRNIDPQNRLNLDLYGGLPNAFCGNNGHGPATEYLPVIYLRYNVMNCVLLILSDIFIAGMLSISIYRPSRDLVKIGVE